MPARTKTAAMCCVTIGFVEVLMPADSGLKVVSLLRGALKGHVGYSGGSYIFEVEDEIDVEYRVIKPGHVRMPKPPAPPAAPLAIGHEPLKLAHG